MKTLKIKENTLIESDIILEELYSREWGETVSFEVAYENWKKYISNLHKNV